jgi:hypothetical protein
MDLAKGKEIAGELLNKAGAALKNLEASLKVFLEGKKRLVLFAFGGLAVLLLVLLIAAIAFNSSEHENVPVNMTAGPYIPTEDLFIPAEPDFLPEYLLEREPRLFWSVEDIRPYWKNPGTPELWREEIKSAVDKLMEGVR